MTTMSLRLLCWVLECMCETMMCTAKDYNDFWSFENSLLMIMFESKDANGKWLQCRFAISYFFVKWADASVNSDVNGNWLWCLCAISVITAQSAFFCALLPAMELGMDTGYMADNESERKNGCRKKRVLWAGSSAYNKALLVTSDVINVQQHFHCMSFQWKLVL